MNDVLLDTHAWAWSLAGEERLSKAAGAAIDAAELVFVSPISFFEIAQKVRLGKWPQMEPFVRELPSLLSRQGGSSAPFDPATAVAAGLLDWAHRDPFDRLMAATAIRQGLPFVSADSAFDGIVERIW